MNALESAEEAGIALGDALRDGDLSERRLREYPTRWKKRVGQTNDLFFRLRNLYFTFDDSEIDWAVDSLNKIVVGVDAKNVDYTGIFRSAMFEHPKLMLKAARMLW